MWKQLILLVVVVGFVAGCQPNTEPIERTANVLMVQVVKPAVDKAVSELSTRTSQLQGQGSLINPGYVIDGFANFGPGVAWRFSMRTDGVSGNIMGATQADQGQATTDPRPPGDRTPVTQPAATQ